MTPDVNVEWPAFVQLSNARSLPATLPALRRDTVARVDETELTKPS